MCSPILLVSLISIWWQDYHSPFYIAPRVGKNNRIFRMVKLRSMVIKADESGVDSTSADDSRITAIGHFIRRFKLDEISQLWNVLIGDMSLVGPRPNVIRDVGIYTSAERGLLSIRPGITDISSIVFSDENEILKNSSDPDLDYNRLIRPWKSRLGLLYVEKHNLLLDLELIMLTVVAVFSRERALNRVQMILNSLNAEDMVKNVARRKNKLKPFPPPGATENVNQR